MCPLTRTSHSHLRDKHHSTGQIVVLVVMLGTIIILFLINTCQGYSWCFENALVLVLCMNIYFIFGIGTIASVAFEIYSPGNFYSVISFGGGFLVISCLCVPCSVGVPCYRYIKRRKF